MANAPTADDASSVGHLCWTIRCNAARYVAATFGWAALNRFVTSHEIAAQIKSMPRLTAASAISAILVVFVGVAAPMTMAATMSTKNATPIAMKKGLPR